MMSSPSGMKSVTYSTVTVTSSGSPAVTTAATLTNALRDHRTLGPTGPSLAMSLMLAGICARGCGNSTHLAKCPRDFVEAPSQMLENWLVKLLSLLGLQLSQVLARRGYVEERYWTLLTLLFRYWDASLPTSRPRRCFPPPCLKSFLMPRTLMLH